jgi:hypothetical protein
MTTLIHTLPMLDLSAPNFSRSYKLATQALSLQSTLIEDSITLNVQTQRKWNESFSKSPSGQEQFSSKLDIGLPQSRIVSASQTIVMHHPGLIVNMIEVIPALSNIVKLFEELNYLSDKIFYDIESLPAEISINLEAVECVAAKCLKQCWAGWVAQIDSAFNTSEGDKTLQNDRIMENPYLPDYVLSEYYVPYDQTEEGNFKSLGVSLEPMQYFNDPSFTKVGIGILNQLLKYWVLENRLYFAWIETGTQHLYRILEK